MDNFTIAVLAGDVFVIASLIALIVFDKHPAPVTRAPEPSKPTGKKTA